MSEGHDVDSTASVRDKRETTAERDERETATERDASESVDREFGRRGWLLVAAIVLAFFVAPGIIVLYPHVGPMFGLTFWDTYLALPMIPAIILAVLAVWATTRP